MGRSQRIKGRAGEQEVARMLRDEGFDCSRNLQQWANGGHDVLLDGVALEVKRAKERSIGSWWRQCCDQASSGLIPVLMYRLDRQHWRVVVPLEWVNDDLVSDWRELTYTAEISFNGFVLLYREKVCE